MLPVKKQLFGCFTQTYCFLSCQWLTDNWCSWATLSICWTLVILGAIAVQQMLLIAMSLNWTRFSVARLRELGVPVASLRIVLNYDVTIAVLHPAHTETPCPAENWPVDTCYCWIDSWFSSFILKLIFRCCFKCKTTSKPEQPASSVFCYSHFFFLKRIRQKTTMAILTTITAG